MTYQEFMSSKKELTDQAEIAKALIKAGVVSFREDYDGWAEKAWIYDDKYVIQKYNGGYHLVIGNVSQTSWGITELERDLYDWTNRM